MKLTELHLREYARVDSTMHQTFTAQMGWDITLRVDLGGIILERANRTDPKKTDAMWVPLSNVRNGTPDAVPPEPSSKK